MSKRMSSDLNTTGGGCMAGADDATGVDDAIRAVGVTGADDATGDDATWVARKVSM